MIFFGFLKYNDEFLKNIFDEIQMTDMMIMFQTLVQYDQMGSHGMDDAGEEPKRWLLIQNGL